IVPRKGMICNRFWGKKAIFFSSAPGGLILCRVRFAPGKYGAFKPRGGGGGGPVRRALRIEPGSGDLPFSPGRGTRPAGAGRPRAWPGGRTGRDTARGRRPR